MRQTNLSVRVDNSKRSQETAVRDCGGWGDKGRRMNQGGKGPPRVQIQDVCANHLIQLLRSIQRSRRPLAQRLLVGAVFAENGEPLLHRPTPISHRQVDRATLG